MEKFMKELCKNPENRDYSTLEVTHFFWSIFDKIHKSNMAEIFKRLYMSPKRSKDTYQKISLDFCVSVRTLERYRKLYVLSFEAALSLLNTDLIIFNVA